MSSQPGPPPPYQPPQGQPSYQPPAMPTPKRGNPWKWIVIGCGGLVLLSICAVIGAFALGIGGLAAVAGRPTATAVLVPGGSAGTSVPAGTRPGIGQTVATKNWQMTVKGVERQKTLDFGYGKKDALGTFVIVEVDMKNIGDRNYGVNSPDFKLKAANGTTYSATDQFGASSYGKDRGAAGIGGQVPPGIAVKYFLIFDVAPDATGLQFQFTQENKPTIDLGQ